MILSVLAQCRIYASVPGGPGAGGAPDTRGCFPLSASWAEKWNRGGVGGGEVQLPLLSPGGPLLVGVLKPGGKGRRGHGWQEVF